jgi:hypothetical protein
MSRKKHSDAQVTVAVKQASSYRQVLSQLGLKAAGGNYAALRRRIQELGLDTSHMIGKIWNRGARLGPKVALEQYLSNQRAIQTYKLKKRLLAEGIFQHHCYRCRRKTWLAQPIPLELEHVNGQPLDNSLDNLTLLCPNCHALTATYRGRNKKSK